MKRPGAKLNHTLSGEEHRALPAREDHLAISTGCSMNPAVHKLFPDSGPAPHLCPIRGKWRARA